tara:strand:- start:2486 stop:3523 length:1038 start_codon:yes stop_codon:yes gene_type:complete
MSLVEIFVTFLFQAIFILIIVSKKNKLSIISSDYTAIQKIHENYTPPFGGLIIFITFYSYLFFFYKTNNYFTNLSILIPSIIIITVGSIEDFYNNIKPIVRFLVIFICSIFYCAITPELPSIEVWKIGEIINDNSFLAILFFSLCMTALSNGMNMIDGMNGLSGLTALSITISLISLNFLFDINTIDIKILIIFAGTLIVFLIFNFPFGKIFLGDAGAYWVGWLLGAVVIKIFSNSQLNSWAAVLMLFYPTMEVCFSTIRKLVDKKNPLLPDLKHLHLKIFFILKGPIERNHQFNSFTTICLMPFWICPVLTIIWIQFQPDLALYFLILFILLYLLYYYLVPEQK